MQINDRLRLERKRLGLTQTEISKACGIAFRTYCGYEAGKSEPKASSLAELGHVGVNINYVIMGTIPPFSGITEEEYELISLYRSVPFNVKAAALGALTAGSAASTSINVSGDGNRVAGRDFHENKK